MAASISARTSQRLGISAAAAELHHDAEVIDLHVDSFIWRRIFGYDFRRRHAAFTGGVMMSQFDLPRARQAGVDGATWVITTNPLGDARDRPTRGLHRRARRQRAGPLARRAGHARAPRPRRHPARHLAAPDELAPR